MGLKTRHYTRRAVRAKRRALRGVKKTYRKGMAAERLCKYEG